MARHKNVAHGSKKYQQQRAKKYGRHRKVISTWRGKRAKTTELISRVYSQRWETKLAQHAVAHAPYTTQQPISLESTAIYKMGYDPNRQILYITFWTYKMRGAGDTYAYYMVPPDVWESLNEASSKGRYFYYNIRLNYRYKRL